MLDGQRENIIPLATVITNTEAKKKKKKIHIKINIQTNKMEDKIRGKGLRNKTPTACLPQYPFVSSSVHLFHFQASVEV